MWPTIHRRRRSQQILVQVSADIKMLCFPTGACNRNNPRESFARVLRRKPIMATELSSSISLRDGTVARRQNHGSRRVDPCVIADALLFGVGTGAGAATIAAG